MIVTRLERDRQHCEIEQFAAPFRDTVPAPRGEIPSVLFTRVQLSGTGPVRFGFRLATENTNRHPELRNLGGRPCIVDRETGAVWLMIEADDGSHRDGARTHRGCSGSAHRVRLRRRTRPGRNPHGGAEARLARRSAGRRG